MLQKALYFVLHYLYQSTAHFKFPTNAQKFIVHSLTFDSKNLYLKFHELKCDHAIFEDDVSLRCASTAPSSIE